MPFQKKREIFDRGTQYANGSSSRRDAAKLLINSSRYEECHLIDVKYRLLRESGSCVENNSLVLFCTCAVGWLWNVRKRQ